MRNIDAQIEGAPSVSFVPPAVESFFDSQRVLQTWPADVVENPEFQTQLEAQHRTVAAFEQSIECFPPTMSIEQALREGRVTEEAASAMYAAFTEYFERDEAHARLALYMPFELITTVPADSSPALQESIAQFNRAYLGAWKQQLTKLDVRANFVDGDVLESTLRTDDHPRVVKATHLIPALVERGILTPAQVVDLAETATDQYVTDGVLDACEVLVDRGVFRTEDFDRMAQSANHYLRSASTLLRSLPTLVSKETPEPQSPASLIATFEQYHPSDDLQVSEVTTPARRDWLQKRAHEIRIGELGTNLAVSLLNNFTLPSPEAMSSEVCRGCIEAIRQASLQQPAIFAQAESWLSLVERTNDDPTIADSLTTLYAHVYAQGIVSDAFMQEKNITIPKLAGQLSENLKPIEPFMNEMNQMTLDIENDTYLRDTIFPVSIVFGSQVKGYGTVDADIDVAAFVRPGISRDERIHIEQSLARLFAHEKIGGKAVLFWLDKVSDQYSIHDWEEKAVSDGSSSWTHVLFGGAWVGRHEAISELHHQLLTQYFFDPHTQLAGAPTRERWLEEMERDTLQYRLLHKGFARYYPVHTAMNTPHASAVDGQTAFYDPLYRRIATDLFLRRVFLPKLERAK
jgi:hypothetical protein